MKENKDHLALLVITSELHKVQTTKGLWENSPFQKAPLYQPHFYWEWQLVMNTLSTQGCGISYSVFPIFHSEFCKVSSKQVISVSVPGLLTGAGAWKLAIFTKALLLLCSLS